MILFVAWKLIQGDQSCVSRWSKPVGSAEGSIVLGRLRQ